MAKMFRILIPLVSALIALDYDSIFECIDECIIKVDPPILPFLSLTVSSTTICSIYASFSSTPARFHYDFYSVNHLTLSRNKIHSSLYIYLKSSSKFSLILSQTSFSSVLLHYPFQSSLQPLQQSIYEFASDSDQFIRILSSFSPSNKLEVAILLNDIKIITRIWTFGEFCDLSVKSGDSLRIIHVCYKECEVQGVITAGGEVQGNKDVIFGLNEGKTLTRYRYKLEAARYQIKIDSFIESCDLYLRFGANVSLLEYDVAKQGHLFKTYEFTNLDFEYLSIGVHCNRIAAYMLYAIKERIHESLIQPGIPYIGKTKEIEYYDVETFNHKATLVVMPITGRFEVFVKNCLNVCKHSDSIRYNYGQFGSDLTVVQIEIPETNSKSTIAISPKGFGLIRYTLFLLAQNQTVLLKPGFPFTMRIRAKNEIFFQLVWETDSIYRTHLEANSITGKIGILSQFGGFTFYKNLSSRQIITLINQKSLKFSVISGIDSLFSIIAILCSDNYMSSTLLVPGRFSNIHMDFYPMFLQDFYLYNDDKSNSQLLIMEPNEFKDFSYNFSSFSRQYPVELTNYSKVLECNLETTLDYATFRFSQINDTLLPTPIIFLNLHEDYHVLLTNQHELILDINSGSYRYFVIPIILEYYSILLNVTGFSGELMVYCSFLTEKPSNQSHDLSFISTESISFTTEHYKKYCNVGDLFTQNCNLYIGITSNASMVFAINLTEHYFNVTFCQSNITDASELGEKLYWRQLPVIDDYQFILKSFSGQISYYIKLALIKHELQPYYEIIPGKNNNYISSTLDAGKTSADYIYSADMNEYHPELCGIFIAIECHSSSCEYFLEFLSDQNRTLLEESDHYGSSIVNKMKSYSFVDDDSGLDLLISVHRIRGGDPDLYISYYIFPVTKKNYNWSSKQLNDDEIVIYRNDSIFFKYQQGNFSIGIDCYKQSCVFLAKISRGFFDLNRIERSREYIEAVSENTTRYFYYENSVNVDINIAFLSIKGNFSVFLNTQMAIQKTLHTKLPSYSNYLWNTSDFSDGQLLIPKHDKNFCISCKIFIAVSADTYSEVAIFINNQAIYEILEEGLAKRKMLANDEWHCYIFKTSKSNDVRFSLVSLVGQAFLFADLDRNSMMYNAKWYSASHTKVNSIDIHEPEAKIRIYFIGIFGSQSTDYEILALYNSSTLMLSNHSELSYRLKPTDKVRLSFSTEIHFLSHTFTCNLRVTDENSEPFLYILTSNNSIHFSDQKYTHIYTPDSYSHHPDQLNFNIPVKNDKFINILITSSQNSAEFTIDCMIIHHFTEIKAVLLVESNEDINSFRVEIKVNSSFTVYLISCLGKFQVEAKSQEISEESRIWQQGASESDEIIKLQMIDVIGTFYIVVIRLDEASDSGGVFELYYYNGPDHNEITPGNNGNITKIIKKNSVNIFWASPVINSRILESGVTFYIFKVFDEGIHSNDYCLIRAKCYSNCSQILGTTRQNSFQLQAQPGKTVITIVASLDDESEYFKYKAYKTETIIINDSEDQLSPYTTIIIAIAIIFLILACIFYRQKHRRNQIKEIELSKYNFHESTK